jgi:hypothetical protein
LSRWAQARLAALCLPLLGGAALLWAGGPLMVGGPSFGVDGQPFTWDVAEPVRYRTDNTSLGNMSNTVAVARVKAMFDVWQNVPTASIRYERAGPLTTPSSGSVVTTSDYSAAVGACGISQNPIIFDSTGSLFTQLGYSSGVIGFAGPCRLNSAGRITGGLAALNGRWQDGNTSNGELPPDEFDAAFIHEFGHFSGLDHAQINSNCITRAGCSAADHDGVPTMFPFLVGDFMKSLSQDDMAWISRFYPRQPEFNDAYGTIRGFVFFSDGVSQAQGVNVIVRRLEEGVPSRTFAVSVVSGYRFTHNPGQPFSSDYLPCSPPTSCPGGFVGYNVAGSTFGSRSPALLGFYEVSVPPGEYTVEVESVYSGFRGGSSVGPLDPPVPSPGVPEYWNENESAHDDPADFDPVTVTPGAVIDGINIILNGTPPRFDQFEGGPEARLRPPPPAGRRHSPLFPGAPA